MVGAASATLGTYVVAGAWWVFVVSRDLSAPAFDRLYLRALLTLVGAIAAAAIAFRATEDSGALLALLASGAAGWPSGPC